MKATEKDKSKNKDRRLWLVAGVVPLIMIFGIFFLKHMAPFGNVSLAHEDARIQYLDFFAYLKDVLSGKNSISYSFSKGLGGTTIGVFTYYLTSPFNLLVLFFEKAQLVSFLDITIALKLALAAITCAVFLTKRFERTDRTLFQKISIVFLSISYALGQYSIAQCSNIMWLDGVYMLPLIMLGIYKLVRTKKTVFLSVTVGLSILFNWYSAGINCFFAIFWFVVECVLRYMEQNDQETKFRIKYLLETLIRFLWAMFLGVVLSAIFFLPTIGALGKSSRGTLEIDKLFDAAFIGNIFTVAEKMVPGAVSELGSVSLYCGSFALIGCIGSMLGYGVERKKRIFSFVLSVCVLALFYWNPCYVIFSLFKDVASYWYRYSHVGIMTMVFLASLFFLEEREETIAKSVEPIAIGIAAVVLFANYVHPSQILNRVYYGAISLVLIGWLIHWSTATHRNRDHMKQKRWLAVLCALFIVETVYSVKTQMNNYLGFISPDRENYVISEEERWEELHQLDDSQYRVSKTYTCGSYHQEMQANYNEAMLLNDWSIASYTSSPDDQTRAFLDRSGYPIMGENMNIINTSILPLDSLLGVKYISSTMPINGLKPVPEIEDSYFGAKMYENPYALPLAFTYVNDKRELSVEDPFLHQNSIYSALLGKEVMLYEKLTPVIEEKDGIVTYTVDIPDGSFALYGTLSPSGYYYGKVDVNHAYTLEYAQWLSPTVFYIPYQVNDKEFTITLSGDTPMQSNGKEVFYALNLDTLDDVVNTLRTRSVESSHISNGNVDVVVNGKKGESLLLSIPYDEGWDITLNGKAVTADLLDDCLYSIPLEEGNNKIHMEYHVKYKDLGIWVSAAGVVIVILELFYDKHRGRKK